MFVSILIAVLVFGAVVLVHEWGHFIAARKCGIFVEEFAIGMGPKLLSTKGGENKTVYSLRLVPIGGFCKMLGEDDDCNDNRAVNNKTVGQRVLVMLSGALMNFLLAFIIFLVLIVLAGYATTTVGTVIDTMPAATAGLTTGDRITHVGNARVGLYEDLLFELSGTAGMPVDVRYVRNGETRTVSITPYKDANGDYKIGFYPEGRYGLLSQKEPGDKSVGLFDSVGTALGRIVFYIRSTVVTLVRLITRRASVAGMSGPIGIVAMIDETYKVTIERSVLDTILTMVNFCALLSANLGIFNLLPLPALDGGRLVFLCVEGIRRKPIAPEREGMVHFVGFVLLMILAVFIAYQDILKIL